MTRIRRTHQAPGVGAGAPVPLSPPAPQVAGAGDNFAMAAPVVGPAAASVQAPLFGNPNTGLTQKPINRTDSLAQNIREWAGRVAVVGGDQICSFDELDQQADWVGSFLAQKINASVAQLAGLYLSRNRPEFFAISLGARRAGVSYTNFNYFLEPQELMHQLETFSYKVLFVDSSTAVILDPFTAKLRQMGVTLVNLDGGSNSLNMGYGDLFLQRPRPAVSGPDSTPPYYAGPVLFTSGTVKEAKRILVPAGSTAGAQANKIFGIRPSDKFLAAGQLYHGAALSWAQGHVKRGAEVILYQRDPFQYDFDPEKVIDEIETHRITTLWLPPHWLHTLCLYLTVNSDRSFNLESLRAIYVSAAPFTPSLKKMAMRLFGNILLDYYATTEAGLISVLTPEEMKAFANSVGRPVPGVTILIKDENGKVLPPGRTGRIFVKTPLTVGSFFETGDVGKLNEDGFLIVRGRASEVIVTGEKTFYPRDIENRLAQLPGVFESHLLQVEGVGLVAVIVPSGLAPLSEADIKTYLSEYYLGPEKIPARVVFADALPRKPYKVDHRFLASNIRELLKTKSADGAELLHLNLGHRHPVMSGINHPPEAGLRKIPAADMVRMAATSRLRLAAGILRYQQEKITTWIDLEAFIAIAMGMATADSMTSVFPLSIEIELNRDDMNQPEMPDWFYARLLALVNDFPDIPLTFILRDSAEGTPELVHFNGEPVDIHWQLQAELFWASEVVNDQVCRLMEQNERWGIVCNALGRVDEADSESDWDVFLSRVASLLNEKNETVVLEWIRNCQNELRLRMMDWLREEQRACPPAAMWLDPVDTILRRHVPRKNDSQQAATSRPQAMLSDSTPVSLPQGHTLASMPGVLSRKALKGQGGFDGKVPVKRPSALVQPKLSLGYPAIQFNVSLRHSSRAGRIPVASPPYPLRGFGISGTRSHLFAPRLNSLFRFR